MEWRRFRVEGRVQGVGFRWWTAREANSLGIRGFVRNLGDGSVEVCAGGPGEVLDGLAERLARGPQGAWVSSVEGVEGEGLESPGAGFEIRR